MEEIVNLTQDDVLEVILDFPITPLRNKVVITTNTDDYEDGDVNFDDAGFAEEQFVLAVGSYVNILKPGMRVMLDLNKMTVLEENPENAEEPLRRIVISPVEVGDRWFGMIPDEKVDYIIN